MDAIVQARMGSTRLPGKILLDLEGKYVLQHVIDRLNNTKGINKIIVATTVNSEDDVIVEYCKSNNILFYRGSSQNVLERFYMCANHFNCKHIMRVTSDTPLIDSNYLDDMINYYFSNNYSCLEPFYETDNKINLSGYSRFPDGFNVGIFSKSMLDLSYKNASTDLEREHVTTYIIKYCNPPIFKYSFKKTYKNINLCNLHLSLDTKADYLLLQNIFKELFKKNNFFGIEDVLTYLDSNSE